MENIVLVADKEAQLSNMVTSILSPRGIKVEARNSGQEILLLLKERKPDLIIIGEQLSDIDGIGLIAKLQDEHIKIPRIFVAKQWRDETFYRTLREDLKVSLVVHRPLRASVFSIQMLQFLENGTSNSFIENGGLLKTLSNEESPPLIDSAATNLPVNYQFEKLKARFISSIPERLSKLEECIASFSENGSTPAIVEQAILAAHNLKGTALSWGFEQLGKTSELLENTLKGNKGSKSAELAIVVGQIFAQMKEQGMSINEQFKASNTDTTDNGGPEEDTSAAKILVVCSEPPPESYGRNESGIAVDIIHVACEEALERAGQVTLDAALIEVNPQNSALGLARRLRDISGYESLPLGFISTPQATDARADAAHAGSSVFLPKPLDAALVQKVVNQLISLREGGRFRVLVVDDDVDLANLTSRCLGQFGILARTVNDPLTVQTAMQEFSPDLILLDINMPGMSGFEVCRALRNTARWRDIPILFLTAQTDLNSRLTAYEAGADDYLPKPVINVELLTRVKVRLERARELKERSEKDLLTGLLLRRAFSDQADALIAECKRYNFHFSICLMDVDHFKKVNDKYGHHAGDEVLSTLGKLLRKRFRVEDLRGRWGGEEFILAFKHERVDLMQQALQRVMDELMQIEFKGENSESFSVSFSAGLASYPDEGTTLQELTKVADKRLYLAKERGRKRIVAEG